jgi:hypothetical protein
MKCSQASCHILSNDCGVGLVEACTAVFISVMEHSPCVTPHTEHAWQCQWRYE